MKNIYTNLFALALTVSCCFTASAAIHVVNVVDNQFTPANLNVEVGDTIRWIHSGSAPHTTTSVSVPSGAAAWDEPIDNTSQTYLYKVTVAGTYAYRCDIHAGMNGSFTATGTSAVPTATLNGLVDIVDNGNGVLTVTNRSEKLLNVTVLDLGGRLVKSFDANAATTNIFYIADLPKGLYVVNTGNATSIVSRKISIN